MFLGSKSADSLGVTITMRPEETLYLQQVKNLGQVIKDSVGKKTTKERKMSTFVMKISISIVILNQVPNIKLTRLL